MKPEGSGEDVTLSLSDPPFVSISPSLTLSFPFLVTLCLGLPGWGPAGPERQVVVNMLNSLSRNQRLPQIAPRCGCVDLLPGRLPFRGYESACSGRHYCLRGMDYCVTGAPCTERHLQPLCPVQPTVRFAGPRPAHPGPAPKEARALESSPTRAARAPSHATFRPHLPLHQTPLPTPASSRSAP